MCINSVTDFLNTIKQDIKNWELEAAFNIAWFRAEKEIITKPEYVLLPKLYLNLHENKINLDKSNEIENNIIQDFRMRARTFKNIPKYNRIDEWLFLMQHVDTYTRLLDWSEGALIALYFAINRKPKVNEKPVVWMLNPIIFNLVANLRLDLPLSWNDGTNIYDKKDRKLIYFKNTKYLKTKGKLKSRFERLACPSNIHAAFEAGKCEYEEKNPIALKPQYIHPRVVAQKGCFTVHGSIKKGIFEILKNKKLENKDYIEIFNKYKLGKSFNIFRKHDGELFNSVYLKKYEINANERINILHELKILGVTYFNLFPELIGLGCDLNNIYVEGH
jgi:hypothetical protein